MTSVSEAEFAGLKLNLWVVAAIGIFAENGGILIHDDSDVRITATVIRNRPKFEVEIRKINLLKMSEVLDLDSFDECKTKIYLHNYTDEIKK